jgi:hypothetical protein
MAEEATIYDLLRTLVTTSARDPQFVNGYIDEAGRSKWFGVVDKAEQLSVFGEMANHLGEH